MENSEEDLDFGATLKGLRPGLEMFGRYHLQRQIGRGGMGVVWLAQDSKLDLEVALKFLPEELVHDESALDDLRQETRRCVQLSHQNIVHVYDLADGDRTAAIVMEYVEGKNLSALRLEKEKRLFEAEEIEAWIEQLIAALSYAHEEASVVHRDLKPANVMLNSSGSIKVMDFGIASSIGDTMTRLTRANTGGGATGGTLPYMSPQQLLGASPSVSDDIYALGATIYELLTGKPPFFRGELLQQINTVVPPSMAERRAELGVEGAGKIPRAWEGAVAACLAKAPEERPQSAAAVWRELSGGVKRRKPAAKAKKLPASSLLPTNTW